MEKPPVCRFAVNGKPQRPARHDVEPYFFGTNAENLFSKALKRAEIRAHVFPLAHPKQ